MLARYPLLLLLGHRVHDDRQVSDRCVEDRYQPGHRRLYRAEKLCEELLPAGELAQGHNVVAAHHTAAFEDAALQLERLDLVRKLGFRDDPSAEVKALAMMADTALQNEDFDRAVETVAARVGGRDVVLTMGAGSVTRLAAPILEALEGRG